MLANFARLATSAAHLRTLAWRLNIQPHLCWKYHGGKAIQHSPAISAPAGCSEIACNVCYLREKILLPKAVLPHTALKLSSTICCMPVQTWCTPPAICAVCHNDDAAHVRIEAAAQRSVALMCACAASRSASALLWQMPT